MCASTWLGAGVRQCPSDGAMPSCLEGAGVDLLVTTGVDVARVANRLRVGLRLLGEQGDFVFREAELVERRDLEVFGELEDIFDRGLGGFPHRFPVDFEAERLRDARESFSHGCAVVLRVRRAN